MKNLIISTFLILSTLATGLMSYQPGEITNLLGAVQTSAQLKDTKRCDAATAGFYGEFVVTSANVSVVERDGKAGVPLPQNILLEAIKYSGLYRDMFLANTSADKIIATAVAERACVISPINYVSVVTMDASDKQYYSPTFLTYCGLGFTTIGNTFTKINGTQTADTLGYGAFLTSQCKPIPLVCKEGEIKTVVDGKEVCQPRPVDCKQYYYKPAGTTTCVPVVCLAPATFVEDKGCVTPPQVCPTTAPGTYPNCVVPPLVCTPPAVLNATKNGCDTTVTTVVCTPPAVINATKTACEIPATPVVCTAPAVLNPTTKVCETPAAPAEKKSNGILKWIIGGAAVLGIGAFIASRNRNKTPTPTTPTVPGQPVTPPVETPNEKVCKAVNAILPGLQQSEVAEAVSKSKATLPAGTIVRAYPTLEQARRAYNGVLIASSANRNVSNTTSNTDRGIAGANRAATNATNSNKLATNARTATGTSNSNARVVQSNRTANTATSNKQVTANGKIVNKPTTANSSTAGKWAVICVTPRKPTTPPVNSVKYCKAVEVFTVGKDQAITKTNQKLTTVSAKVTQDQFLKTYKKGSIVQGQKLVSNGFVDQESNCVNSPESTR